MKPKSIDSEYLKSILAYDESSPSCLRWAAKPSRAVNVGDPAGYRRVDGYYGVKIGRKIYPAHRIVMQLHGHSVDGLRVDHLDRNRSNNKIENLRLVSQSENNINKSLIVREEQIRGFKYFSVLLGSKGKVKRFSVYKHGEQKALELAQQLLFKRLQGVIE